MLRVSALLPYYVERMLGLLFKLVWAVVID